ncbi:Kinase, NEK [Giardia lamblia P15]|uniref:Kinase, NEK n=1 Tax=Giardia intestinalis (strain P15) TaxID=658858 RepID=E1F0M4_GIAIA|nr:Kinase, NEK [Giardia lamblia P15]
MMRAASSGSATATPSDPQFTLRELHERLGGVLSEGATGIVYSLKGYPGLIVKAIRIDDLGKDSVDAIRLELAALPDISHPGAPRRRQVVEDEGFIYVVTDRHDKTLEDLLAEHRRRKSPVSTRLILSAVKQLAAALVHLHSASGVGADGLVHHDLRPTNILISEDGEHFVIADLGLSRNALLSESTFAGTAAYRAPEALLRNEASPASDMWSLGAILYELATLRRPGFLEGREPREVFVDRWKPDLSGVVDGFVKDVLERIFVLEPDKRLTAKELHAMLTTSDVSVDELRAQYAMLKCRLSSLETALSDNNARIALLEEELKVKSGRIAALETALETGAAKIGALEDRMAALESRLAQAGARMNAANPQPGLLLLPRLARAAHMNDTETVRMLLRERFRIGQRDKQGLTALMHAAQQGHTGPAKLLAEKEKGLKDRNGWTALMHATHNNQPEVVKILAPREHGKRNKNGRTALMMAAEEGHAEAASVLAPYEADLIDSEGKTALMLAARAGHEAVVEALDPTDDRGVTALMRAAGRNDAEAVRALVPIQRGRKTTTEVTINGRCMRKGTALMLAAAHGYAEVAELLAGPEGGVMVDGWSALMLAARCGRSDDPLADHPRCVELLVGHEGGISGWTGLIYAAYRGDIEAVRDNLHMRGSRDAGGWTALMWAACNGHPECVRLLVKDEGGMQTTEGWTALMGAAHNNAVECARLLRESERDLKTACSCRGYPPGTTALDIAKEKDHGEVVEILSGEIYSISSRQVCQLLSE